MSIILQFLNRYRYRFLLGVAFLLATTALSMMIPRLLKLAIEEMQDAPDLRKVGRYALAMIGIATLQAVVRTLSRLQLLGMSRRVACDFRNRIFSHLLRLPAGYFDRTRTGDIMSRVVNDMRSIRSLFGPGLMNLVNTIVVYVIGLILMARIDLRMTLLALIPYPILLLSIQRLGRLVHRRTNEVQQQLSAISNLVQENLSAVHLVRTFAQEGREIERFEAENREYLRRNLQLAVARGGIMSLMGAVGGLGTAVVLWLGGLEVLAGRITLGDFVAFNGYLAILAWPTVAMGWVINVFQRGFAAIGRINEILDQEPETAPADGPRPPAPVGGDIEFRDVTFRYPGSVRPALDGLNLTIPAGCFVGVVGPIGSGKSTLAQLLARLYRPDSGDIRIGGRSLDEIPRRDLRRGLGLAPQEPFLFSRSLRDNVAMGMDPPEPDRIVEAGRVASLEPDLADLPDGWDTVVGERGYTLSGGQRQRAALARALAPRPRILVLDDSLSSLDAETEQTVLERMRDENGDRTVILISHRLTSVLAADRVFVLDGGRLVEEGPPAELLDRGRAFSDLFRQQRLGLETSR